MDDQPTTISDDLSREKMIYKALQQDQKEGEAKIMEINVSFLIKQLRDVRIQLPTRKADRLGLTSRSG